MLHDATAVGAQLGLSASKLYELASIGDLVSHRFDDALRFDQVDVDAYTAR